MQCVKYVTNNINETFCVQYEPVGIVPNLDGIYTEFKENENLIVAADAEAASFPESKSVCIVNPSPKVLSK